MNSPKTSVLLGDDHELVRQGTRRVLEGRDAICGGAANGQEAVEKSIALKPDVVIFDVSMPVLERTSQDLARSIEQEFNAVGRICSILHSLLDGFYARFLATCRPQLDVYPLRSLAPSKKRI